MLINRNVHGYSTNKKYVIGRGFVDSLSSIFNSIKSSVMPSVMPTLRGVGSYLSTNKDQIIKPLLGAVGTLGAKALTEGVPALINKIQNRNKNKLLENKLSAPAPEVDLKTLDDPKYKELLRDIMTPTVPVSNIIGMVQKLKSFRLFF